MWISTPTTTVRYGEGLITRRAITGITARQKELLTAVVSDEKSWLDIVYEVTGAFSSFEERGDGHCLIVSV